MRLWRLSSLRRSADFTGGYGLLYSGRWNTSGRPVTYCATVSSLAALEKRVHVKDPALLPAQVMVEYEAPDDLPTRTVELSALSPDWSLKEVETQQVGDRWLDAISEVLLIVPSVIVPLDTAVDRNVLINHRHARASEIRVMSSTPFSLDPRLFRATE